jgi:hypothetical protein
MNNENKAPQRAKKPVMVDITRLHTPSGYADLIGHSRANVYLMISSGNIQPENIFKLDGKQQLILEDGKEDERRKK